MTMFPEDLDRGYRIQAAACRNLGSAFSGDLLERAADGALGDLRDLHRPWLEASTRKTFEDATPLRFLGALHHLTLTGAAPDLAAQYPAAKPDTDWPALIGAAKQAVVEHHDAIAAFMTSPPQTNEVRRSLCLVGGYLTLAAATGLPLRCLEIGASAGLNVNWDRYAYRFGEATWGDPASPVQIAGDWDGPPPPLPAATVAEREACDVAPVDITDEANALRLQAYVWPDQLDRLERLRAAIAMARQSGLHVEKADAAIWVAARLAPRDGVATVLVHSVMWQYMPAETQASILATLARAAAAATPSAPVAHLSMEPDPANMAQMQVRLTLWPGGEEKLLAEVHPHGASVRWLA
ncbi:MAG: hypothetical protein JWP35_364 [Caulobacter sp.]|nr:hypothetical protein [Caulobacter sp.]